MKKPSKVLKDYFIPHDENDNKPQILRPRTIAFVCMVLLVAESVFVLGGVIVPNTKLFGIIEANTLVDETNQNRISNDLPALQVSPLLQAAAQEKANDMATKDYFAHTSPQGLTPWYWFENVGYNFDYAGENLAVNFSDSQDVTTAWMNSPEHRANILSTDFTQIGIATAQGIYNGQEATYVVEEFGTPAPAAAPVAFVNSAAAASVPTTAPIPETAVPAATTATAISTQTKTTTKAVTPVAPIKPVAVVPTVVAIQSSTNTSSDQTFLAVKSVSTQVSPATPIAPSTTTTASPIATTPAIGTAGDSAPVPQGSFVQQLFSNPKMVTDDFYIFLIALFALALVLNIFIKIQVQYPRLIAGGVVVIVVAGLLIMFNQNIGLLHAAIL